jgi:DNA-binding MarR family transcriptional regulator
MSVQYSALRIRALLARKPGRVIASGEICALLELTLGLFNTVANNLLKEGKIERRAGLPGRRGFAYVMTEAQAKAFNEEIEGLRRELGVLPAPVIVQAPPPAPAAVVKGPGLGIGAVELARCTNWLLEKRDKTVWGEDAVLRAICTHFETALAAARKRGA